MPPAPCWRRCQPRGHCALGLGRETSQCVVPSRNPRWKCPSVGDYCRLRLPLASIQSSRGHLSGIMPLLSSGGSGDPPLSAIIAFASTRSSSHTEGNSTCRTTAHDLVNENVGQSSLQIRGKAKHKEERDSPQNSTRHIMIRCCLPGYANRCLGKWRRVLHPELYTQEFVLWTAGSSCNARWNWLKDNLQARRHSAELRLSRTRRDGGWPMARPMADGLPEPASTEDSSRASGDGAEILHPSMAVPPT